MSVRFVIVFVSEKRTQPPFVCQLFIHLEEERQEIPVWINGSLLDDKPHGLSETETLPQHEISQDQSGGAAHAHDAMHQHLPCGAGWRMRERKQLNVKRLGVTLQCCTIFALQPFVYEVRRCFQVLTEIEPV